LNGWGELAMSELSQARADALCDLADSYQVTHEQCSTRDLDWLVNNGLARTVGHRKYEATTAGRAAAGLLHAAEAPDAR